MRRISIFILFSIFYFLFFSPALAASLYFESSTNQPAVNQLWPVDLILDPESESINAVEGSISFPKEFLEVMEIREGGSLINFWVDKPAWECQAEFCQIIFSGIVPGGFSGVLSPYSTELKPGKIIQLIFKAKKTGQGSLASLGARALLNDGLGTPAKISFKPFQFAVSETAVGATAPLKDTTPPEPFTPQISSHHSVFDGRYFLVFSASDKGAGIDHYEVKEGNRPFKVAESPHLLEHQKLDKEIIVRAIDKSGNVRTAFLAPTNPRPWYEKYAIYAIIVVIALFVVVLWRKNKKN